MRKFLFAAAVAALTFAPAVAGAHEPVFVSACASDTVDGAPNDCVLIHTDTEFEDGIYVTVDGDDTDPRGDDITDGYITVHVGRTGTVDVYCEDTGGFNHPGYEDDDANGANDDCRDAL